MRERRFLLSQVPCYSLYATGAKGQNDRSARFRLSTPLSAWPLRPFCILLVTAWLLCGPTNDSAAVATSQRKTGNEILYLQNTTGEQEPTDILELKLGQPIEREIAEGATHLYRLALTAGQYLNITVEQKEANVTICLLNPSGKAIAEIDWGGKGTTESLWALAESTGEYQLQITTVNLKGSAKPYIVKLEKVGEFQTAAPEDQSYVRAYRLFWGQ